MNAAVKNIALLFFSRNADAEAKAKPWLCKSRRRNKQVASSLILQSYEAIRRSGLPVFHYHEGNQRGKSFGERLANAYEEVFAYGYDAVIAVGNDSPELVALDWQAAIVQLRQGRCVLGPSHRGGAYLIGLTREAFDKTIFLSLPWKTGELFSALKDYCSQAKDPFLLDTLHDLNTFQDLRKVAKSRIIPWRFRKLLYRVINNGGPVLFSRNTYFFLPFVFLSNLTLRAPPR